MQLRELYDGKGNKRMYREDENGKVYVYVKDRKEKLIIRDFFEDDVLAWVNAVKDTVKLTPIQKNACMDIFRDTIRKRDIDDEEFTLLITTNAGKILGTIDVKPAQGERSDVDAEVQICVRNDTVFNQKTDSILRAIWNMHKEYNWYDHIYLNEDNGEVSDFAEHISVA